MNFFRIISVLLFTLTSISLISCKNESDSNVSATWEMEEELVALSVESLLISKGKLIPYIEASGIIRGVHEAWALSETQGKIENIKISLGQKVKKGDVLVKVEDDLPLLNNELAFQQFSTARLDFDAIEQSYNKGGFSRSDFNKAQSHLLQAEASYELAKKSYFDTSIRAPFDGVVALMDNNLSVGTYISAGQSIARIIDTSALQMEISLGERQINLVEKGLSARIEIPSLADLGEIMGKVAAIARGSDPNTGSFPLLITWENKNNEILRSGLSAQVKIETIEEDNKIIIPSSAIVVRNRTKSVFLVRDNKSFLKAIDLGESLGGHSVVKSGLNSGDILIISALSTLANLYPVEPRIIGNSGDWK